MWIEIKKDIFEHSDFKGINFIIQLLTWQPTGSIPRYNIFVASEKIQHLENYQKLSDIDKETIEKEFDKAIIEGVSKGKYIISKRNKNDNYFDIEEAVYFLNQPLSIVLENSLNDSYFLKTIFQHFGKTNEDGKKKLVEFVKNNWIQFVNAGGWTNIRNYITGSLNSYNDIAARNSKENHVYLKCFVMVDSDKQYLLDSIEEKEKLKNELEAKGIQTHILKKRAMENYMPDDVIQSIPNLKLTFRRFQKWVYVYNNLTNEQKDFLNYKDGFVKGKTREEQNESVRELYSTLNEQDYNTLNEGLKLPSFKDYFPSLFENNHLVYWDTLLNREGGTEENNELLEILHKINNLL